MKITVANYGEFVDKVFDASGDVLDIDFSSSRYEDGVFNVSCDQGYRKLAVQGEATTTLAGSFLNVCAAEISVGNLLFDTPYIANAVFTARAEKTIQIGRCGWLGAYLEEEPGLSVLHVEPMAASTRLEMVDSWLIDNLTNQGHTILGCHTATSGGFSSVTYERTAFIDNRSDFVIGATSGKSIQLRDCLIVVRDPKTVFLGARTKGAAIHFTGCTIVAPSFHQIVSQWASDASPGDFEPAVFDGCHVYLTDDDAQPDGIRLQESTLQRIAPLADDGFRDWMERQKARARAGSVPDPDELRQGLISI